MSSRNSSLDSENCRSCSSFQDYVREAKKKFQNENKVPKGICTLTKSNSWFNFLRTKK